MFLYGIQRGGGLGQMAAFTARSAGYFRSCARQFLSSYCRRCAKPQVIHHFWGCAVRLWSKKKRSVADNDSDFWKTNKRL